MKVLSYIHHAPFVGCFWQYQYILVKPINANHNEYEPFENISGTKPLPNREQIREGLDVEFSRVGQFSEFQIHNINKELYKSVAVNDWPTFHEVLEAFNIEFKWSCDKCGFTIDIPYHSDNYAGDGSVGIEYYGWTCRSCYINNSCTDCGRQLDDETELCWTCHDECKDCNTLVESDKTYCDDCQEYINEHGE